MQSLKDLICYPLIFITSHYHHNLQCSVQSLRIRLMMHRLEIIIIRTIWKTHRLFLSCSLSCSLSFLAILFFCLTLHFSYTMLLLQQSLCQYFSFQFSTNVFFLKNIFLLFAIMFVVAPYSRKKCHL